MNDFIELRRVSAIILRRWWWLALLTLLGALAGYVMSRQQTPVYQATTTILVGDSIRSTNVDRVDIQVSEALVQTYVEVAQRQPVLQGVVTALNLNGTWQALSRQIQVTQIESTQLIEIVVEGNSPEMARRIADEIVNQLILLSPTSSEGSDNEFNREQLTSLQERIVTGQNRLLEIETAMAKSISEIELADLQREKATLNGLIVEWERNYTDMLLVTEPKRNPTQLSVIESAHSNNNQIRPRVQLNTLLGGALGMIIGLGLIFLLDFLDDTYKSLNDFSQSEEVNILGSIRKIKGRKLSDKLVARLHPHSPVTESYRIIRSRLRFKPSDKPTRSIMVTSSMPEEGKSVTTANLAVVFAQANYRTVIVDADLRHPALHEVFEVNNEVGLGDLLGSTDIKIEDCIQDTSVNNLKILTSGMPLLDPSERLGSERMKDILDELKSVAEVIIVDSPPVLVYADAIVLSGRLDGVIMVIQAGKSTRAAITQTLFDLQNANANLLGSIFNQSPKSDTFSVNKAYMQERPQLPSPVALAKKQNSDIGPFQDLRDSAMPLNEKFELPGLVREEEAINEALEVEHRDEVAELDSLDAAIDKTSAVSMDAVLEESERNDEIAELDSLDATIAETSAVSMDETVQQEHNPEVAELQNLESDVEVNDTVEVTKAGHEEADTAESAATVHEHHDDVAEQASPGLKVEADEKALDFQEKTEGTDKKSRKRRARKNKSNGSKSEEVAVDQINIPVSHETNARMEMDQISDPIDHDTVLVDQNKDE
ncbi:MAG: polysaccharide biosynthesis tyrosine autokinase [Anaerolineales bacterium]